MDLFTGPSQIAATSQGSTESGRTLHTQYGGDAKNDASDGINNAPLSYSMVWDLTRAQADTMLDFLASHAGVVFQWVVPTEGVPRCWLSNGFRRSMVSYDHHQVQVNLIEQFRP